MHPDPAAVLARYHVSVGGAGTQGLLFAHGFGCDQTMWRHVLPAFQARYRTVSFDFIGAGRSDLSAYDPARYATLHGFAQDVIEIVEALGLSQVVMVGHSAGAMAGLLASQQAPDALAALLMIGPSPRYINDPATGYVGGFERADVDEMLDLMETNFQAWAHALAPMVINTPGRDEVVQELGNSFCAMDPAIARRMARTILLSDHRADLAGLRIPSLILQCTTDALVPPEVGDHMARHVPGSRLQGLRATGHCPHMSHPDEVVQALQAFLQELGL